ncbi:metallophosphoesterase [Pedobacter sp. PAMC26386]|nr:metallophosphoesterase [Pedobacter sp. PAMC26386]
MTLLFGLTIFLACKKPDTNQSRQADQLSTSSRKKTNANGDSDNFNDGPYVLYRNGQIEVRTIVPEGDNQVANTQTYDPANKSAVPVNIKFSNHPDWNFSVKLRNEITNENVSYTQPTKILALSDIEGEFEAFRSLLLANHVIDEQYNWIYGNGHLIICGDLFDRGKEVPATLWLLYKLEQDAKSKGGYLHTILGDHEFMNMNGDLRYLQQKYLDNAALMNLDYNELYTTDTELGRWLRSKNVIEKVGDYLCLHGGVSPAVNNLKMSLSALNSLCRSNYDNYKKPDLYTDQDIKTLFDGKLSPFWYRGYFKDPKATTADINKTLSLYNAKKILVGHTIISTNVGFYYSGKVIGLDVDEHNGDRAGALFENNTWYKIDDSGDQTPLN